MSTSRVAGIALGAAAVLIALTAIALLSRGSNAPRTEPVARAAPPVVPAATPRTDRAASEQQTAQVVPTERVAPNMPSLPRVDASPAPVAVVTTAPKPAPAPAGPAQPSEAEIQAALRATSIVMFSTDWCGHCSRARAFFDANGITREERDIERDPRARAELIRLTGKASVPVFLIDGALVGSGFSEASMKRYLVASVEKRLGVRGIRARTAASP